jgi:hypothetical protein
MKSKLVFLFSLSLTLPIFGQDGKHKGNLSISENKSEGDLHISDLEKNGINSKLIKLDLSINDIHIIRDFNFDKYRDFSNVQLIQISNGGPILELYSIEKLINDGFVFDTALIEDKKGRDYSGITHQTMPIVNIGFALKHSDLLK